MHPRRRILRPLLVLGPLAVVGLTGYDYGARVVVRSEADIMDFDGNEDMTEEERTQLLELYNDPLDLNKASREDLYLLPDVTWEMADAILERRKSRPFETEREVRSIVGRTIYQEIKPFVFVVPPRKGPPPKYRGSVTAKVYEQMKDETTPMVVVRTRHQYGKTYDGGLILAEEQGPYGFTYEDEGFTVEGERPNVKLERAFFKTNQGAWSAIAGNYMAGFGLGLTFDITDRSRPDGFYHDLAVTEDTESYDSYSVPKRLFGVAGQAARIPVGDQWLRFTGFASMARHDLYCADLSRTDNESFGCTADNDDTVDYVTFPNLYREDLFGMNASFYWADHSHVGFTAWGGRTDQETDFLFTGVSIPNRDFYGAGGVDVELNLNQVDVLAETAITDSGGVGARVETVSDVGNATEITAALRYYGANFDNPHSRGQAQPDEYSLRDDDDEYEGEVEGSDRDRDEIGPQVAVVTAPAEWTTLRFKADLWNVPSQGVTNAYGETRAHFEPNEWLGVDLQGYIKDKDLKQGGREQSYESYGDDPAAGQAMSMGGGLRFDPKETFTFQTAYKERYADGSDDAAYDRTWYTWAKVIWDATPWVTLSVRAKYYNETPGDDSGERYRDGWVNVRGKLPQRITLDGRYQYTEYFDTEEKDPNPEHKVRVSFDWRF